jgi:peptidoglycan hydrolase-like protein with peptidoglycan-binding domain
MTARKPPVVSKKRTPRRNVRKPAPQSRTASADRPTPPRSAVIPQKTSDDSVRRAQEALDRAGYEIGNPDGLLGPRTIAAIKRFQTDRYLPVSGQLDEVTLAALGVSNPLASGAAHLDALADTVNSLVSFIDETGKWGIMAATNAGLYQTFDPEEGWNRISYASGIDVRTTAISISAQNPKLIFVGTATAGVLVSRDAGETWQQVGGIPTASPVNVVVQDPRRSSHIYVGTKQAFYSSHDGGDHWSRRGGDLPFGDFTSILINPRNPDEIFTGNAYQNGATGGGVYRSTNSGSTWVRIDARELRLPSMRIWALALDPRDQNTLFVGSHSAGVYVVSRGAEASLNSLR